ncbi:MAG: hypothetical protein NC048_04670 [Bacteroides sp.]|nr:hypothetical protein [Ruminococcus flavefaciens]MCM1554769.1 hypothetical protein [Bacteroides sp.]
MKPINIAFILLCSVCTVQAQTFVDSFLKNKDSITIYHNRDGQEMIPVVRFYLFADRLVPDTSGRIDADRLLSQWNQYLLGKTTTIYSMYRQKKPSSFGVHPLRIEGAFPEPDLIVQPYLVCYAPEDDLVHFWGLEDDGINHILESKCSGASSPKRKPKDRINHTLESKCSPCKFEERKLVCFSLCEGMDNKWFLKGDTLYTGYVWATDSNRIRLRTVQETLDDIHPKAAHIINRLDETCIIPAEKRQKIVRILDDEIIFHYLLAADNGGFCGVSLNSKEFIEIFGYRLVPCEEAYRERGEENQYHGPISYRRVPSKKDWWVGD